MTLFIPLQMSDTSALFLVFFGVIFLIWWIVVNVDRVEKGGGRVKENGIKENSKLKGSDNSNNITIQKKLDISDKQKNRILDGIKK